ncbi:MAG: hypothetical protein LBR11_03090 [Deltaproteobacteria bacterium]|jgi:hypothetical protein|nr:hypothetical protein [Deltaproteobacteria bacterium]
MTTIRSILATALAVFRAPWGWLKAALGTHPAMAAEPLKRHCRCQPEPIEYRAILILWVQTANLKARATIHYLLESAANHIDTLRQTLHETFGDDDNDIWIPQTPNEP